MHSKICLQAARAVARPCELKNMHRIFVLNNAAITLIFLNLLNNLIILLLKYYK